MEFVMRVNMDSAAFSYPQTELRACIERALAQIGNPARWTAETPAGTIRDSNGNRVGEWSIT